MNLNSTGKLISKALNDLYTSLDEFVLVNKVSKKFDDMKEETEYLKISSVVYNL